MGRDMGAALVSPSSLLGHTTPSHLHLYTGNAMVVPYPTAQKDNRVLGEFRSRGALGNRRLFQYGGLYFLRFCYLIDFMH